MNDLNKIKFNYRKILYPIGFICLLFLIWRFTIYQEPQDLILVHCYDGSIETYYNITYYNKAEIVCGAVNWENIDMKPQYKVMRKIDEDLEERLRGLE